MTAHEIETAPRPPRRFRKVFRPLLLALLVLAMAASVVLNILLYRRADLNYRRLSEAQLDPFGLQHRTFPPDAPADAASRSLPAVVFFGDSRALAWPPPPNATGFRFVNRGIGGQTSAQVLGRFDAHVEPVAPRIVVVQAGINDLKAIGLFPDRRDKIVRDCKENLRLLLTRAREAGATVIVTTIFPPGKVTLDRRPVWSPEIERAVEDVNADLRGLASDRVIVLDAWNLLAHDGRLREGYGLDMLHLNARGYDALNTELVEVLRALAARAEGTR